MNIRKNTVWLACLILALSGFGWHFVKSSTSHSVPVQASMDSADIIISNLTVRRFNETGQLMHFMSTPKTQHFPASNTHLFESPYVALRQPDQPLWEINSHFASAKDDGSLVTFFNNVIVHQNKGLRTLESTMTTEELIYLPKEQLAMSTLDVLFKQPGRVVSSKGVKIHLAEKQIQLSKAYAEFLPSHS